LTSEKKNAKNICNWLHDSGLLWAVVFMEERKNLPTIYDVARESGLSTATVSRVINSSGRVSESSRKKVMEAIETLGFVPHAEARAHAMRGTGRIGVIAPFFTSPSFAHRLRGVAESLSDSKYEVVIYTVDSMERLKSHLGTLPVRRNLDGLIIISLPIENEEADRLASSGMEVVMVEKTHPRFSGVTIDDHHGGRMAAEHFARLGHTRTAFVYFGEHPPYSIHPEFERLAGFREALVEQGLSLPEEYVRYVPISRKGVRKNLQYLLSLPEPPTAIFTPSDELAMRIIHAARESELDVPEDLSVLGFDDIELAETVDLTTISQSLVASGEMAVELLLARLKDSKRPNQIVEIQLKFIERGTTAQPKQA
jgi:LacI family transcriptional regulator